MSKTTSPKKLLVELRLLALTAPSGRTSMIEAVRLLHRVVPTDNVMVLWHDGQCNTVDVYQSMDAPLFVVQDYFENFMHALGPNGEEASGFTLRQAQASGQRISLASQYRNHSQFLRSSFYNRVLRVTGGGWTASLSLKHADGTPLVSIIVGRSLDACDFDQRDVALLEQAHPWLEHLARREGKAATGVSFTRNGDTANLLIDATGKVLSASAFALTLLHQAADTPLAGLPLRQSVQGDVSILLQRFSSSIASSINALSALPPSLVVNNRWGRFHLMAYVLHPLDAGMPIQISLHIERLVPLSLALFRRPKFLALTPREREVCLHILAGLMHTEIAQVMCVKPSTVIYFTRQLYQRLDINRQSDLLSALMHDAPSAGNATSAPEFAMVDAQ